MTKFLLTDFEDTLVETTYIPNSQDVPELYRDQRKFELFVKYHEQEAPSFYNIANINTVSSTPEEFLLHFKFYSKILDRSKIKTTTAESLVNWRMNRLKFKLNVSAGDFIRKFASNDYQLVLVSNALPSRKREIEDTLREFDIYKVFISYKVGYYKPQKQFYLNVLNSLEHKDLDDIVYIDDQIEFINIAEELGIKRSFLVNQTEDYISIIDKLNL